MQNDVRFERISPALKLTVNKRARRMALRLDAKNRVVNLVMPPRASLYKAYEFAKENKDWILEKISALPVPISFVHGAVIPLFGKNVKIKIKYEPELKTTDIVLKGNKLICTTGRANPSPRIRRFLLGLARERIAVLAHKKAERLGRKIHSIQIRDTVSRWGSCSEDGQLSFSWRLIFAPAMAFDYVISHEVAHLAYMDHSDSFWRVCARLSRGYNVGKDWMRDFGHELMRYGAEIPSE